ncbi:MAG: acetyl-CoA acetyltransferase [Thomasclavelia sp.]|uniref:acetyl-CoA acetyltransferase n=1 Tax=Thomasclavelia sp. TaxID=3025757 RepID=UPI0039A0D4D8
MNKVFILGGSQTDFKRNWSKEGKNVIALLRENIFDAMHNVKLTKEDVIRLNKENKIAVFVGNFIAENYIDQGHLGALLTEVDPCFYGVPSGRYEAACASGSVAIDAACSKIRDRTYDVALVIGFELMKTVDSKVGGTYLGKASYYEHEGKNIDYPFPKLFARLADETIKKYALDEKRYMNALSSISYMNYMNAKKNDLAQTRDWYMDDIQVKNRGTQSNPIIGGRLALTDCSQVTDGAATVILCSEEYKEKNFKSNKPDIKGFGHRVAPMQFDKKIEDSKNSKYILPWTRQACVDAYQRAGLTVNDIDVFETHDCFTSSEYAAVSCFGITEPGEEYQAIEDGTISFFGKKPINPSGGLIGCGHPVGASGVRMMLDLYRQVTNNAGNYQVRNVKNAMMLNIGGSATTNYVFIVGVDK